MYGKMFPNMTKRVSISELQNNALKYFHDCQHEPVEVIKYGCTVGYLVPPSSMSASLSINSLTTPANRAINNLDTKGESS